MTHSPTTHDELIALVHQWHQDSTPWIPSGLGTRLHWGATLTGEPAELSCRKLNKVIDHAVDDLTITVEAGLQLSDLQSILKEQGQWLPIDWPRGSRLNQTESMGSIGGLVARGLAGGLRQRHLGMRDQIIGIGLLRSDGTTARAGGRVVKNVAGYDLMRLLCGSWGSLALITELTLRVQPIRPAHRALHLHGLLPDLERCRAELLRSSLTPERCDWHNRGDQCWALQLLVSSISDQAVEDQLNRLEALARTHQLTAERHPCSNPLDTQMTGESMHWLVRPVLQPAKVHQLLSSSELQQLAGWHWNLASGAGCGDGWQPATGAQQTSVKLLTALRKRLEALGGSLMILEQPQSLTDRLPAWVDAPSKAVIEAVKHQFDPKQQLSPGRLHGVSG